MNKTFNQFALFVSKINKTHIQFTLMLLVIVLLVVGAGAPEDVGGIGRQMILLTAVFAGTIIGWGYAGWKGRAWQPPAFQGIWLVLVGFLPQLLAFYLPHTRGLLPDGVASASLIASQVLLLVFTLANIRLPGMFLLTVGLACNLVAILLNDGFMPLRLESAAQLVNPRVLAQLTIGERISNSSKDILLPQAQILLPWLADRFVVPEFLPYRFVFSAGDVLVAVGAFWMLSCGRENTSSY